jgi:hypothetical protein
MVLSSVLVVLVIVVIVLDPVVCMGGVLTLMWVFVFFCIDV